MKVVWQCNCGKYRGIKFKDVTRDKCGSFVKLARVFTKLEEFKTIKLPWRK